MSAGLIVIHTVGLPWNKQVPQIIQRYCARVWSEPITLLFAATTCLCNAHTRSEQEELTAQKQAEAVKARASLAAIRAQAKAQIRLEKEKRETEKERRKTEYALWKLELEHQFRLAQLSRTDPHASSSTYHGASSSISPGTLPMLPHPNYSYPSTQDSSSPGSHSTTFDFSGM